MEHLRKFNEADFNGKKQLNLVPMINAMDLSMEAEDELTGEEISTHYEGGTAYIDWDDEDGRFPVFSAWLLETYGEIVKNYTSFTIDPT